MKLLHETRKLSKMSWGPYHKAYDVTYFPIFFFHYLRYSNFKWRKFVRAQNLLLKIVNPFPFSNFGSSVPHNFCLDLYHSVQFSDFYCPFLSNVVTSFLSLCLIEGFLSSLSVRLIYIYFPSFCVGGWASFKTAKEDS